MCLSGLRSSVVALLTGVPVQWFGGTLSWRTSVPLHDRNALTLNLWPGKEFFPARPTASDQCFLWNFFQKKFPWGRGGAPGLILKRTTRMGCKANTAWRGCLWTYRSVYEYAMSCDGSLLKRREDCADLVQIVVMPAMYGH